MIPLFIKCKQILADVPAYLHPNIPWGMSMLASYPPENAAYTPFCGLLCALACPEQAELERQIDELRRFQKLTVGRELRMKELAEENTALRNQIAAQPDETKS